MRQPTSALSRFRVGVLASLGLMMDPVLAVEPQFGPKSSVRLEALADDERRCKKHERRKVWFGSSKGLQEVNVCVDAVPEAVSLSRKAGPRNSVVLAQ